MAHFRKAFLPVLLLVITTVTIASAQQSNCSAKIDQLPDAPELRGFHLGMTYDQVRARVPPIQFCDCRNLPGCLPVPRTPSRSSRWASHNSRTLIGNPLGLRKLSCTSRKAARAS